MLPQSVIVRQACDEGGFTIESFVEDVAGLDLTTGQELSACPVNLFGEVLEIIVG